MKINLSVSIEGIPPELLGSITREILKVSSDQAMTLVSAPAPSQPPVLDQVSAPTPAPTPARQPRSVPASKASPPATASVPPPPRKTTPPPAAKKTPPPPPPADEQVDYDLGDEADEIDVVDEVAEALEASEGAYDYNPADYEASDEVEPPLPPPRGPGRPPKAAAEPSPPPPVAQGRAPKGGNIEDVTIRDSVQKLAKAKGAGAAVALLKKYGVKSPHDIPQSKRPQFIADLNKATGGAG